MTGIFSLHPEDPIGVGAPRAIDPNSVNTAGWWGGIGTTLATAPIRALMAVGEAGSLVGSTFAMDDYSKWGGVDHTDEWFHAAPQSGSSHVA